MPIPDSFDDVDLDNEAEYLAFLRRIIDSGAEEVRKERMAAVAAGIIDLDGNILRDRDSLVVDERLTVEQ